MRMDILSEESNFPLIPNHLNEITIESHSFFEKLVQSMNDTIHGLDESVRLWTDENEKIDLHKNATLIASPFDLTFSTNEFRKKLIQKLLPELEYENFTYSINQGVLEGIDLLIKVSLMSDYDIEFDSIIRTENFLKLLDVRLKEPEGPFRDKLCEYILQSRNLLGKEIWILANCNAYLNKGDSELLEEFCNNEKICIINVCAGAEDDNLEYLPKDYIVDNDLCELYL